jgi:lauroyl/myristoyl acyltransferase
MSARRRLPFLLRRLREAWAWRRFRTAVSAHEELTVRIAYGNLFAALGQRSAPRRLRQMARRSRSIMQRTLFEIRNPLAWPGYSTQGLEHLRAATSEGRGAVVISFHVGPYRFLPLVLALNGYHVDIVVDERGIGRETSFLDDINGVLAQLGHWHAGLDERVGVIGVINAQKPDVALRMSRALKQGHVVFVMLDGNTGAGARKAIRLHGGVLFAAQVLVRAGVGEIADAAHASVVLALSWRRRLRRDLFRFHAPIQRADAEARADFGERVVRELVSALETRLAPDPGQWEEWHHLHKMQDIAPASASPPPPPLAETEGRAGSRYVVDSYRAFAVADGEARFVFEPRRRTFVPVSGLGVEMVRLLYEPRSEPELLELLGPTHGGAMVRQELAQLRSRGWAEMRP